MKHCLECLIYLRNRNKNLRNKWRSKNNHHWKSMLIKTGYPNLLHGCDFLCSNLTNYWVWEVVLQRKNHKTPWNLTSQTIFIVSLIIATVLSTLNVHVNMMVHTDSLGLPAWSEASETWVFHKCVSWVIQVLHCCWSFLCSFANGIAKHFLTKQDK